MDMHQVDPSSKLIGSNLDFGSEGSKGFLHQKRGDLVRPPNLTRALGKGRMSSFFFLLLQTVFSTYLYLNIIAEECTGFHFRINALIVTHRNLLKSHKTLQNTLHTIVFVCTFKHPCEVLEL